jgi:sialate O-acetylesterase
MRTRILIIIILFIGSVEFHAEDWQRLINLKGLWKFSIGDDIARAKPNFNDQDWEIISVPSSWENEGFNGYNGYAWYRKSFHVSTSLKERVFTLRLGRIDDVDEVYLNGHLIGSTGTFPPDYNTAYFAWREYHVPQKYLNFGGENVIAIRVYDSEMEGGIIEGEIGLFEKKGIMKLDIDLAGKWKFNVGDESEWKEKNYNDDEWAEILVPAKWELQIGDDYDGFAWYRLIFTVPETMKGKKLVFVLGKIDDIDEAYLNGKQIGETGNMNRSPINYNRNNEYQQTRGYFIPDDLLEYGKENVIAVRVYDGFKDGGIYEGPIGLIEQSKYTKYWRNYKPPKQKKDLWDLIFQ